MLRKLMAMFMAFALTFVMLASALVVFVPEEASASTAGPINCSMGWNWYQSYNKWTDNQGYMYPGQATDKFYFAFNLNSIGTGKYITDVDLDFYMTNTASRGGYLNVHAIVPFTNSSYSSVTLGTDITRFPATGFTNNAWNTISDSNMTTYFQDEYDAHSGWVYIALSVEDMTFGSGAVGMGGPANAYPVHIHVTYETASEHFGTPTIPEGAFNQCMTVGPSGFISATRCYVSGNTVLTYDRVMLLAFDVESEIGINAEISDLNLTAWLTQVGASTLLDVYPVPAFTIEEDGWGSMTFTDEYINANLPEDGHTFQLHHPPSTDIMWAQGNGMNDTWQEQYEDDGIIYLGIAGWNFNTASESFIFDLTEIYLSVTYEKLATWQPTITSTPVTNVSVAEEYEYELEANESVTWSMTVTPPTGGSASWLSLTSGVLKGTPFPLCKPEGIGNYSVSIKATSTDGGLDAYQNFTLKVKSDNANLGDLLTVSNAGIFGENVAPRLKAGFFWEIDHANTTKDLMDLGWDVGIDMTVPSGFPNGPFRDFETIYDDSEYGAMYTLDNDLDYYPESEGSWWPFWVDLKVEDVGAFHGHNVTLTYQNWSLENIILNGRAQGPETATSYHIEDRNHVFSFETSLDESYNVSLVSLDLGSVGLYDKPVNDTITVSWLLVAGTYDATVKLSLETEFGNLSLTHDFTFIVEPCPVPAITSTAMAKAYVGEAYSFTFAAVETDLFILQYPVPSWATWDNATGTFTGTPEVGDLGVYMIVVYPYNTTAGITGDPFYAQFIVRPAAEAGDGIGFFGYVFSSIIALLFCIFLSISKDGFNATVFMALVPMATAVLISAGAMPLWTIIVGILFYGILIFRNVGPGDSL